MDKKEEIIQALVKHKETTQSNHIFYKYLIKQTDIKSGSVFWGLINELVQEGVFCFINNENTNIAFTPLGKEVAKIGYSNYLKQQQNEVIEEKDAKIIERSNQKFTFKTSAIILIISILGIIISVLAYFKPIK